MYRRLGDAGNEPYLPKNDSKYTAITESEREMAEPVEVKGQALAQNEPFCMVSVPVLYLSSGTVCFSQQQTGTQRRPAYAVSLYRCGSACGVAASTSGTGFFVQRRTGDGFSCRLRGTGPDLGGRSSGSPESRSRFAGRDCG